MKAFLHWWAWVTRRRQTISAYTFKRIVVPILGSDAGTIGWGRRLSSLQSRIARKNTSSIYIVSIRKCFLEICVHETIYQWDGSHPDYLGIPPLGISRDLKFCTMVLYRNPYIAYRMFSPTTLALPLPLKHFCCATSCSRAQRLYSLQNSKESRFLGDCVLLCS